MSFFVSREEVPVTLDDESVPYEERNTIFIKPEMDFGTYSQVQDAFAVITADSEGKSQGRLNMGAYNRALLHYNITRWQGPGFQAMPCTPENIDRLPRNLPLLEKVLEEINARNTNNGNGTSPNPRKSTSAPSSASTKSNGASRSQKGR